MTDSEHEALTAYVHAIARSMELRDWQFEVLREPPANKSAAAHVEIIYGRKLACIRFKADFRTETPEELRHTVTHELVHCHVESASNMVRSDLSRWLGEAADMVFWEGFKRQLEYGVDALASALAPHQAVLSWPSGGDAWSITPAEEWSRIPAGATA